MSKLTKKSRQNTYILLAERAFEGKNATIDGLTEVLGLTIGHGKVDLNFDGLTLARCCVLVK